MSGRGGKRQGAGRRLILGTSDRLVVGRKCEAALSRIAKARERLQFADDLAETNIPEFWQEVNQIPIHQRKAFLASRDYREHSAVMDEERKALRLTSVAGRYGVRKRVLSEVTHWASFHFGLVLKPSYIEDCWEEYRQFAKEL